jgi:Uma2 family endonuclease
MQMAAPAFQPITPAEYLEAERKASTRHEYVNGTIYAMAGATRWHVLLVGALVRHLGNALAGTSCNSGSSDLRVAIPATDAFLYPDVVIYCGEGKWLDDKFDTLLDPIAVIEVLSPSTEAYDRGAKFQLYKKIESIRHFVFVSQDVMNIDAFERKPDGSWSYSSLTLPDQELRVVDAVIPLSTIYERVPVKALPEVSLPADPR